MFLVENSGRGNCLYYAYGVSLMYYLRKTNDHLVSDDIFTKLQLEKTERGQLAEILLKPQDRPFSKADIQKIIEPILGKACRKLAAEHTKAEFNKSPKDTSLYTATKYGMEFGFKKSLEEQGLDLSQLIDNDFSNPDYKDAEVYKVPGMGPDLEIYIRSKTPEVVETFNQLWEIRKEELTKEELEHNQAFHQRRILDGIIENETVEFFLSDHEKHLNEYIKHLQTNFNWGTEETLMTLHRAIQGERMVRNNEDRIEMLYDHVIALHVYRNGNKPSYQNGNADLILNNQWNAHWTSIIPESIFTSSLNEQELSLMELLEGMQEECEERSLGLDRYPLVKDWLSDLRKKVDDIKACRDIKSKETEIMSFYEILTHAGIALAKEPALNRIFSTFQACIPSFLAACKVKKELETLSLFGKEKPSESPDNMDKLSTGTTARETEVDKDMELNAPAL